MCARAALCIRAADQSVDGCKPQPTSSRARPQALAKRPPTVLYVYARSVASRRTCFLPTPFLFLSAMRALVLSGIASNMYSISIVTGPIKRIIIPRGGIPWCLERRCYYFYSSKISQVIFYHYSYYWSLMHLLAPR